MSNGAKAMLFPLQTNRFCIIFAIDRVKTSWISISILYKQQATEILIRVGHLLQLHRKQSKAPPHEGVWGSRGVTPRKRSLSIRWRSVVSITPWPLCPGRMSPGTHGTGRWVIPREGTDALENKISYPCRELNQDSRSSSPMASHYTDWATPALLSPH